MFEPSLSQPRRKKRSRRERYDDDPLPFPVPIASVTGVKASDTNWTYFRGQFRAGSDTIRVWGDREVWSKLERGGSFGAFSGAHYRNKKRQDNQRILAEDVDNYSHVTVVEDADPQILDNENNLEQSKESSIPQLHHVGEEKASKDDDDEIVEADPADISMEDASDRLGDYLLTLEEAYFLSYALGCLLVTNEATGCDMDLEEMWDVFSSEYPTQNYFAARYAVYHHFRSKGWVVRPGVKFGADFLLYKDGPVYYHASYSVLVQTHSKKISWVELSGLNRVTESAHKELIVAHVERRNGHTDEEQLRADNWMDLVRVREVLVRRWVPSAEREDAEDNHLKRTAKNKKQ